MADKKYTARLREYYKNTIAPALQKEYSYKNVMEIPKIDKIVEADKLSSPNNLSIGQKLVIPMD